MSVRRIGLLALCAVAIGVVRPIRVDAQSCAIATTARGPVSCSIATTMTMTVRIPELVGVNVNANRAASNAAVTASLAVKANRPYAVQIANADEQTSMSGMRWRADGARPRRFDESPSQVDSDEGIVGDHPPVLLEFSNDERTPRGGVVPDQVRVMITVVAP